jgi:uncharacterized protein (TIGR02996 family)
MDAEAGFMEAIRERSDDRERWLIFADWLEEQGDPRGELIRLQVHLAELPAEEPGRETLVAREFELFHKITRKTLVLYPPRVTQIIDAICTGGPIPVPADGWNVKPTGSCFLPSYRKGRTVHRRAVKATGRHPPSNARERKVKPQPTQAAPVRRR